MIPTNSSGTTNGCDNISSNCVVWQGPDIACIDLCSGDTISEVTAKIATKVCDIITNGVSANPSLTGLDITCLNVRGTTPTQLVPVLQAMVNQICLNSNSTSLPPTKQVQDDLPIMTLPACMQYNDASGNPVTQLRLDLFAELIANQVCTNLASIQTINSTLTSYSNRLDVLEACVLPCSGAITEVQIVPTCVTSTIGQLTNVSVVVLALESAFCALRNATGTPANINTAINQTTLTGASQLLSNSSATYSSISGWSNTANTLAQSVQNAWVVIDDMYAAITDIQTNCCPSGCDGITFAYTSTSVIGPSSGLVTDINMNFMNSTIPSSFNDSAGFTIVTVTDSLGASTSSTMSVALLQNSPTGQNVNVSSLNVGSDLNVAVQFSVTDGSQTCEANQSSVVTVQLPCPSTTWTMAQTTADVSLTNSLGNTAQYVIDILDANNIVVDTVTKNNPGGTVTHQFTGLTPDTAYQGRVTVSYGGNTRVCPVSAIATTTASAPCANGMDVAFIIDYSSSMGSRIDSVKAGVASLVTTIDNASGANNYRVSLVGADEEQQAAPTYATCTDYTSLPAAQKVANLGSTGKYQIITAWEMFQVNNGASFTTQLNKLNKGVDGTCINLGDGVGMAEPTDYAAQLVTGSANFTGAFRSNVAKYVIIITDALPSGTQDQFNATTWAGIQSMILDANTNGIKYFICGPGVQQSSVIGGSQIYPWRELADQTGGAWNQSSDPTTISNQIIAGCS
jgi:hypothetical protein